MRQREPQGGVESEMEGKREEKVIHNSSLKPQKDVFEETNVKRKYTISEL